MISWLGVAMEKRSRKNKKNHRLKKAKEILSKRSSHSKESNNQQRVKIKRKIWLKMMR